MLFGLHCVLMLRDRSSKTAPYPLQEKSMDMTLHNNVLPLHLYPWPVNDLYQKAVVSQGFFLFFSLPYLCVICTCCLDRKGSVGEFGVVGICMECMLELVGLSSKLVSHSTTIFVQRKLRVHFLIGLVNGFTSLFLLVICRLGLPIHHNHY